MNDSPTQTINREFLVKTIPQLTVTKEEDNYRYYIYIKNEIVIRVQRKNETFELERKENVSNHVGESTKIIITEDEYLNLRNFSQKEVIRTSYRYLEIPEITIRVYKGKFSGLIRAEIYFKSIDDASKFVPYPWLDREITGTPLSQDSGILSMTEDEFKKALL